ncbi:MAG: thioredoxin [Polyangiaceae bacterium]
MIVECPSCAVKNRVPAARIDDSARCGKCKSSLYPLGKTVRVESSADFIELIKSSPVPVLVDFWAPWCGPCRMVGPELERVASEQKGHVIIAKVNTDELGDVAGRYDIQAIPTMILFSGGQESKRLQGAMRAPAIVRELGLNA